MRKRGIHIASEKLLFNALRIIRNSIFVGPSFAAGSKQARQQARAAREERKCHRRRSCQTAHGCPDRTHAVRESKKHRYRALPRSRSASASREYAGYAALA